MVREGGLEKGQWDAGVCEMSGCMLDWKDATLLPLNICVRAVGYIM